MHGLVDRLESIPARQNPFSKNAGACAGTAHTGGKKQYGYLKKPLKDMVDSIVDELEKLPEVAAYYAVWNGLRDTLEGYYKNRPRQHNPLSQQKEFRAIKNAIIQEAERLRQQMEQESSQEEEPSPEEGRNFYRRFYKFNACKRECFVHNFLFCAASVRISSEFNHPPVSPDGTNLPRQCRAAQQSHGYPHRLQAPKKAHAKAAGNGT